MAATEQVECPRCGSANGAAQRFCGNCGSSLALRCPSCGEDNAPSFKFCGTCGSALGADAPEPEPTEARRWVTVLFADLSGFTQASETMDPEDVAAMIDRCMSRLGEVVAGYGGYVEKIIGDQIMVLFGAPTAHEDDAERAVRAGLEMQSCTAELQEELAGLTLRVGINTGEVMFAPVGPESARRFTVMGDAVNTASRLESNAPRGGVLVGEETYRGARRAIRFEEVDPVTAKGKAEPVPAWLALGVLDEPAAPGRAVAPLVGRDKELFLLQSLWRAAVDERRPHAVTVVGVPGIGKSRLVRELLELVVAEGDIVIGRCLPYGDSVGYSAFAQQVKHVVGIFDTDEAEVAAAKLTKAVGAALDGPAAAEVADHLALVLGLEVARPADKAALFLSARRFVEAIAADRPTVLVFDDIHWADPTLLDLIESLAAKTHEVPLLIVCLARPELYDTRPTWGGGLRSFTAVELDPLGAEQSAMLANHLLRSLSDVPTTVQQLAETAGGNPFFLEELVSSLAEGAAPGGTALPTSIRALLAARLDALPTSARQVLADAAVMGKTFWRGVLDELHDPESVARALDFLETRHFVRREQRSRLEGDEQLSFRHILSQEAAYAMIPKATRRIRHGEVARILEARWGDRPETAAMLAHHHREAGNALRAADYLEVAASAAGRAWAKGEAIELCSEALELVGDDAERRRRLRLTRGRLLVERGDFAGAVAELEPLLGELDGADRNQALQLLARAHFWSGDAERTKAAADEAIVTARILGDDDQLGMALGLRVLATSLEGRLEEGVNLGVEALPLIDPGRHPIEHAQVIYQLGIHQYWMGRHEDGLETNRRATEFGQGAHELESALGGGAQYAMCLAAVGRVEEALEQYAAARARCDEIELFPRHAGRTTSMWAGTLREIYDLEGARALIEEAMELGRRAAFLNTAVQSSVDLLLLDLLTGDVGRAERELPALREQAVGLKGWHEWLVGGRLEDLTARVALARGDNVAAATAALRSIDHARRHGRAKYESWGHLLLAQARANVDGLDEARAHADQALAIARRIKHAPSIWAAADVVRQASERTGDDEAATAAARTAVEAVDAWASGLADERRERFLSAPPIAAILAAGT
jgi:class 3 adenylate cyclase/tetratricopeptide (TPR) repeat protein